MLHFIPLQDSSKSSDIASNYCRCIIVKIVFQLHKPHYKEMWCSIGFCAWRMWRSIITKLELFPLWVCKSFFSLGIACFSYGPNAPFVTGELICAYWLLNCTLKIATCRTSSIVLWVYMLQHISSINLEMET